MPYLTDKYELISVPCTYFKFPILMRENDSHRQKLLKMGSFGFFAMRLLSIGMKRV